MRRHAFYLATLIAAVLSSCVSQKKLTYIQDQDGAYTGDTVIPIITPAEDYLIQNHDILAVNIRSIEEEDNAQFNAQTGGSQSLSSEMALFINGYSVDKEGNIDLPVVGKVHVAGKKVDEAEADIKEALSRYFNQVYVSVQLSGMRFSVLGEVRQPGKYIAYQNQLTIFEAIAMAGDIDFVGKRKEVQLVRTYPDGARVHELDLTSIDVISSPYYYLQPNDIVYVKPMTQKSLGIGTTAFATFAQTVLVITNVFLVISLFNTQ
jgi:polysaccharide export outer membrane protein